MRLLLTLGLLLGVPSLAAQAHPLPGPHPAPLVWASSATPPVYPTDTVRATTGAGTGTWVGAGIGALEGFTLSMFCGLDDSAGSSCLGPNLLGIVLGGFTGAMIGSALEGDQPSTKP